MTVVLVHWNQPLSCAAVARRFLADDQPCDVIVVDNSSEPNNVSQLVAALPDDVEVLRASTNLGFGPGANIGARHWLAHRDSDVLVVAPHDARPHAATLRLCVEALLAESRRGLASADVGDGATPVIHPFLGPISAPPTVESGWEPADYPHGTLMVMRRECAHDIGLFDERYFAYCEEADLGLRASRAGWDVGVVRGALVENPQMGPEARLIDYLMVRNTILLLRDNFGRRQASFRLLVVMAELVVGVFSPHRRTPFHTPRARIRAMVDVIRGRYGPPPPSMRRSAAHHNR